MGDLSGIVIFAIKPIARYLVTHTADMNSLFGCEIDFMTLGTYGPEASWANRIVGSIAVMTMRKHGRFCAHRLPSFLVRVGLAYALCRVSDIAFCIN
jgi:hypothetical protein